MKKLVLCLIKWAAHRSPKWALIEEDIQHWQEILLWHGSVNDLLKRLIKDKQEFRNLLYYRLGGMRVLSSVFKYYFPPLPTLYIWTEDIGGGLFIQHGFATVIAARRLGRHCFVNQQVTIGYNGTEAPVIGDNVTVTCGAKVIGGVKVGDNVVVGANSVVVKDVPADSVVVGVPAFIVKRNGIKCHEQL